MTRAASLRAVLVLGLLGPTLTACSSDPAGLAFEDISLAWGGAICAELRACAQPSIMGTGFLPLLLTEAFMERCPEFMSGGTADVAYLRDAVDAGRITYDPLAARRCINDMAASCVADAKFSYFPACREALRGNVALGGACNHSEECAPSARCDAVLTGSTCEGACVDRLSLGAPCTTSSHCAMPDGFGFARCSDVDGTEDVCITYSLVTGVLEGEPCGPIDATGSVRSFALCEASSFCAGEDANGVGTCTRAFAVGAPCRSGQPCEWGSACVDEGSLGSFCRRLTLRTGVGDACDDLTVFCDGPGRLTCVNGQCALIPAGTCIDAVQCESGEYCADATGTCEPLKPLTARCTDSFECLSRNCGFADGMAISRCVESIHCG